MKMQKAIVIINDDREVIDAYNLDENYIYELFYKDDKWLIAKGKVVE